MSTSNWEKLIQLTNNNAEVLKLVEIMTMESMQRGVDAERKRPDVSKVITEFDDGSGNSASIARRGDSYSLTRKVGESVSTIAVISQSCALEKLNEFIEECE